MDTVVVLSYFHRKIGPLTFSIYPEDILGEETLHKVSNILDQAFDEGYFTHSLSNVGRFDSIHTSNFYFEISSSYARGNKEMVMVSVLLPEVPSSRIEQRIIQICGEFSKKLQNTEDIYKGFYAGEALHLPPDKERELDEKADLIRLMLRELYWEVFEHTREKTEEERLANIMAKPATFYLVHKLEEGAMPAEALKKWYWNTPYAAYQPLDQILHELEREKIVFTNEIGHQKYILLVKSIHAERVPPEFVIPQVDSEPELLENYLGTIQELFNYLERSGKRPKEETLRLFQIVASSNLYSLILQLKEGPMSLERLNKMHTVQKEKEVIKAIEKLKESNIVREFSHENDKLIVMISIIQIFTGFPKYLESVLRDSPNSPKPHQAQSVTSSKALRGAPESVDLDEQTESASDFDLEEMFATTEELEPEYEEEIEGSILKGKSMPFCSELSKKPTRSRDPLDENEETEEVSEEDEDAHRFIVDQLKKTFE